MVKSRKKPLLALLFALLAALVAGAVLWFALSPKGERYFHLERGQIEKIFIGIQFGPHIIITDQETLDQVVEYLNDFRYDETETFVPSLDGSSGLNIYFAGADQDDSEYHCFYPDKIAGPPLGPGETYTRDEEVWDWYYAVDDDYFQYLYDLCEDNAENIGWTKVESGGE